MDLKKTKMKICGKFVVVCLFCKEKKVLPDIVKVTLEREGSISTIFELILIISFSKALGPGIHKLSLLQKDKKEDIQISS